MPLNRIQNILQCFALLIVSLFQSCEYYDGNTTNDAIIQKDSIRFYIDQSKLNEINTLTKSKLLNKAYTEAQSISSDSLKCQYYTEISFESFMIKDSILFEKVSKEGIEFAEKTKDSVCLAGLHKNLGQNYYSNRILDSAFHHYVKAEKIYTRLNDDFNSGLVLNRLAWVQNIIGDFTASERTSIQAIEKLKPFKEYKHLRSLYDNLGDVSKQLGEYERALAYYNESFEYIKKANLGELREYGLKNNIALVYQKMGQHQKAANNFKEVITYLEKDGRNPRLLARSINNLGYSYLKSEQFDELPALFERAISFQDSLGDIGGQASSNLKISEYYILQKDTLKAIKYLNQSNKLTRQSSFNKKLLEILTLYTRVDPKNAVNYHQEYAELNDSLQLQERQLRGKFERIQFETKEVVAENQLLAKQRQLWTGIAGALMLLGFASFIIFTQRSKNQKLRFNQAQQEKNQEILNLMLAQSEKIEQEKQKEQKRISEELHDGVQGRLQGSRMMLLGLNGRHDEEAVKERERAIVMLQDIQEEVRAISHELSHSAYQKINNFILSIQDLANNNQQAAKININLHFDEEVDWDGFSGDIKINLYRIIQESIQNAIKHGECENIDLNLNVVDSQLIKTTIKDDGKGFNLKKGRKGIGMRNINSRAKKLKGNWNIDSDVGKGTTVSLEIPIA